MNLHTQDDDNNNNNDRHSDTDSDNDPLPVVTCLLRGGDGNWLSRCGWRYSGHIGSSSGWTRGCGHDY